MSVSTENIQGLLLQTKGIMDHQEEIKNLRGENFNIFSVLKMETRENATHSAFLGELLNPKGSHLYKSVFLELFLKSIGYKGSLDIRTARLELEKHVGARDDVMKTGGRIDICISDANGNTISIENKIYAGDQYAQIERYAKHNSKANTVYYLTLNGNAASEWSKGELKEEDDYCCLSYKKDIHDWLQKCLKEAAEQPILRETIRQYILLIKKLTNQLSDSKMEKEIYELIARNYSAAKIIEANVNKVEYDTVRSFLFELKKRLELELKEGWSITIDENLNANWTGIKIEHKDWNGIYLRLQGEPKIIGGVSIYGVVAHNKWWDRNEINTKLSDISLLQDGFQDSAHWPYYKVINIFNSNEDKLRLFDEIKRSDLINKISNELIELANECLIPLAGIKMLQPA